VTASHWPVRAAQCFSLARSDGVFGGPRCHTVAGRSPVQAWSTRAVTGDSVPPISSGFKEPLKKKKEKKRKEKDIY